MEADDIQRLQDGLAEFAKLDDAQLNTLVSPKVKAKAKPRRRVSEFTSTSEASERTPIKSRAGQKERELLRTTDLEKVTLAAKSAKDKGLEVIVHTVPVDRPPAVPWQPRTTSTDPAYIPVCPIALRQILDRDRDMSVYDKRALVYELFCGCCGRPVWDTGATARNSKGGGVQCPECGLRRVKPDYLKQRERLQEFRAKNPEAVARASEGKPDRRGQHGSKQLTTKHVQELIDERVATLAEQIMKPFEEGIMLEPNPEWSEMTKLEFYLNQTQIADKMLDRSIGKAVQRNRMVNHDDADVIHDDELSPEVVARMVAAIATGSNDQHYDIDGDVEDAELIEDDAED